jgi:hypothetical protein
VNIFGPRIVVESSDQTAWESNPPADSLLSRRKKAARAAALERNRVRLERDIARGYSVNVKQVVLAFAIEFVIIGLILNSQYYIGLHSLSDAQQQFIGNSNFQTVLATIMNFPVALAMVELARVPLALAVRTQNSWNIKLCATVGVLFAITVTSFSLSTIAYQTFDPRLVEVQEKNAALQDLKANKEILTNEIRLADKDVDQKQSNLDRANASYKDLQAQITAIPIAKGENCTTQTDKEGSSTKSCTQTSIANKAQLQTLQSQLADARKYRDGAEAAVTQAQAKRATYNPRDLDGQIVRANFEFNAAISRSQLHSYTSMIMFKAPKDVTEAEVKNLEKYLIFIPSIAAAFASTLIAITAVRSVKPSEPQPVVTIPDEAANYLFGPLMEAIKKTARDVVTETMGGAAKANAPPAMSETTKTTTPKAASGTAKATVPPEAVKA